MPDVAVDDKLREECGVLGIFARGLDVVRLGYFGLFALQHRGQESAGLAVSAGEGIALHKGLGLVSEAFNESHIAALAALNPHIALGHVRYSTAGPSDLDNSQPLYDSGDNSPDHGDGSPGRSIPLALAHNGNLIGMERLKAELAAQGAVFGTTSDSEMILLLLRQYLTADLKEALIMALNKVRGAYSLVLCTNNELVGVRDPQGFRPLCLGRLGDGYILASESAAIEALGGELWRDVEPGEMVVIDDTGVHFSRFAEAKPSSCIFEYVYFARNDSIIDGQNVYEARVALGRRLAEEQPVIADLVISVPDSGTPAAIGYAACSKLPYVEGLVKNRYVGRTFIQPGQALRELKVRLKFTPNPSVVRGKRIIIIDDSIVRGTTMKLLVSTLRQAGASEIHVRVSCPPYIAPCHFGIDTPSTGELVATRYDTEGIRRMIGADSLGYLSKEGMLKVLAGGQRQFCLGCFTGEYPVPLPHEERAEARRAEEDWGDVRG